MRKNKRRKTQLILLVLVLTVSIGYAAITTTLKINGSSKVNKATWSVYWDNVQVTEGSVTGEDVTKGATIKEGLTEVEYEVTLKEPGDFYEFTVDAVNNGTIDAMIAEDGITNEIFEGVDSSTIELPKYVDYSVTYSDGTEIAENHLLAKKGEEATRETYKVRVEYKKDIVESDLEEMESDKALKFNFGIEYVQADDTAKKIVSTACKLNQNIEANGKLCKRAESLHTEVCNQTGNYCSSAGHSTGDDIVYGNCGTSGELKSGNAFDCDVDGNGVYDSKTERFYYVSDYYDTTTKSFNSDYATLIYYNNVKEGVQNNTTTFAYDSSNQNWHGPQTGYVELPSTSQWSKVTLLKNPRQLLNQKTGNKTTGGTLETFEYTDKAARLLTVQELEKACGITVGFRNTGELDTCEYLLENTKYSNSNLTSGYWTESARSDYSDCVWRVYSYYRLVSISSANFDDYDGVRPAIDVLKSNISY